MDKKIKIKELENEIKQLKIDRANNTIDSR